MAHGLQTPLATIEGYVEGLLDGVVEPEPGTWAVVHAEGGRLRRLVTEVQALSRAEVRQRPVHLVIGRRAALVAQALAPQFADKDIVLTQDAARTSQPCTLTSTGPSRC